MILLRTIILVMNPKLKILHCLRTPLIQKLLHNCLFNQLKDSCEFFQSLLRSLEIESSTCRVVGPTLDNFFKVTLQPVFQCSNGCPSENLASLPNVGFLPIPATNCNTVEQSLGQVLNTEDGVFKNCGHCPGNIGRVTTKIETFPERNF